MNRSWLAVLLMTGFIAYGSLYPFDFSASNGPDGPFGSLMRSIGDWDRGTDLIANILFYMPLGLFIADALPSRMAFPLRFLIAVGLGSALSTAMELLQFHIVDRVTSMGDVEANAIGTACGAIAAGLVHTRSGWRLLRPLRSDAGATLVVASWFGYRMYPYVPSADLHKYWRAIRDIVLGPHVDPFDLVRFIACWMLIAVLVERIYGRSLARLLFTLLLAGALLARILIVNIGLSLSEVAGSAAAWLIWMLAPPSRSRAVLLAIVFTGLVCALRLQPFTFEDTGRSFGWVPLVGLIYGSPGVAIQSFLEKMFLYGGMTWLIREATGSLAVAIAIATTLVFATSLLELDLPGRSAEITDAVLALSAGIVFALLPAGRATNPKAPSSR